ncbi:MAG: complex I NDUFA9 subunit family protein [Wenzhouxiangella sp.]|nr:MAG: complex I NDUFA9 subunit family protein [Wenzhouxiangella sp.]
MDPKRKGALPDMTLQRATLIGGTGFVGRALIARLLADGVEVRAVARNAESAQELPQGLERRSADVGDPQALREALAGADAAVYLPGQVQGRRRADFLKLHVLGAQRCAELASEQGLTRFIYLSALGASRNAPAWSDQTKAEGEERVRQAFPGACIVRPSLVLGPGDHFSTDMLGLMRKLPILPVIGPDTRVQPVHIDDLSQALYGLLNQTSDPPPVIQAAGPKVWRLIDLLAALRDQAGLRCRLLPLPHWAAMLLASVAGLMPGAPICRDQVRLMRTDKIADPAHPDLTSLGIRPRHPPGLG